MRFENLKIGEPIKFECRTQRWGVAYFYICPVRKNGIITKLYIQRAQQSLRGGYCVKIPAKYKATSVWFSLYGLPDLNVTLNEVEWCHTHKASLIVLHAPPESNALTVEMDIGKVHVCFRRK